MSQSDSPVEGSIGRPTIAPLPLLQNPNFSSNFSYAQERRSAYARLFPLNVGEPKDTSERSIEFFLLDLGIPPHLKGFSYIRAALVMLLEDEKKIFGITKILYPDIAKLFETTSTRVERAIRHSIELCWARKTDGLLSYSWKEKPSNAEFLATLARSISLSLLP